MKVYNTLNGINTLLKQYDFYHSYFGTACNGTPSQNSYLNTRLRLDSLIESHGALKKPPHYFDYYVGTLPAKTSQAQDHWGYYNGKNTNLNSLPSSEIGTSYYYQGADREPDPSFLLTGMLHRITYPTGGSITYDYEPHDYSNFSTPRYTYTYEEKSVSASYEDLNNSVSFTLTEGADVSIQYQFDCTSSTGQCYTSGTYVSISGTGISAPSYAVKNLSWSYNSTNPNGGQTVHLFPGTYRLYAQTSRSGEGVTASISVFIPQRDQQIYTVSGGGLRIKKITNSDGNPVNDIVKEYKYRKATSTGRLSWEPSYAYSLQNSCSTDSATVLIATSNAPLARPALGTTVGYSQVTVWNGLHGVNGKSVYQYLSPVKMPGNLPYLPSTETTQEGLLAQVIDYKDTAGIKPVRRINYQYAQLGGTHIVKGMLLTGKSPATSGDCACLSMHFYASISEFRYLTSQTERLYDPVDTNKQMTTTTQYFYDNLQHLQVTRIKQLRSDGTSLLSVLKHPLDYPSATTLQGDEAGKTIALMASDAKYMHAAILEKQVWHWKSPNDSTLLSAGITTYQQLSSNVIVPKQQWTLETNKPLLHNTTTTNDPLKFISAYIDGSGTFVKDNKYQRRIEYQNYDLSNNILLQMKENEQQPMAFVWGYGQTLQTAEVKNATRDQIAYSSFESPETGYWTYTGIPIGGTAGNYGRTGKKYYPLSAGNITKTIPSGNYLVSFWAKGSGIVSVNGTGINISSSWAYYEIVLKNVTSITLSSNTAHIDELRLHPPESQMVTLTYDPLVGITSQTDANNFTVYYEYDELQRLKYLKDHDGNIIKQQVYHFKGQP
jgi:hypothetical protein